VHPRRSRGVRLVRIGVPSGRAAALARAAGDGRRGGRSTLRVTPYPGMGLRAGRCGRAARGAARGSGTLPRRLPPLPPPHHHIFFNAGGILMRVLAALSGGVDSAVAAARAVEAGHDVVGVHMALSRSRAQHRNGSRGCCSIEDASDARRAADVLGIPYYVWDLSEEFEDTVVADFLSEYEAG